MRNEGRFNFSRLLLICSMLLACLQCAIADERPKIGLALSGGGAKGLAHIGVLKVLEEIDMPIDFVAGTSMGSIVGGLYAAGYSARQCEEIVLSIDWVSLFSDAVERRDMAMEQKPWDGRYAFSLELRDNRIQLPSGLIAGQKALRLLTELLLHVQHIDNFRELPTPFVCAATDLVTGELVVLDRGFLPEAIRASMAIPSVFTPIKIDGRLLVDGLIVRNLPAQEAFEMGADTVICVDVGSPLRDENALNTFLGVMDQAVSFQVVSSTAEQREKCDYLIVPDFEGGSTFDYDKAALFIRYGEEAARKKLPELQALADQLNRTPQKRHRTIPARADSITVNSVVLEGLDNIPQNLILSEISLELPTRTTIRTIKEHIDRIYGTGFFERVTYRLDPSIAGSNLVIRVVEKSEALFQMGLRYDTSNNAAMLLNTEFRNVLTQGSFLTFDLRLGDNLQFDNQFFSYNRFRKRLGFRSRLHFNTDDIDVFDGRQRIRRYDLNHAFAEFTLGSIFSTTTLLSLGARAEYAFANPTIGPVELESIETSLLSLIGTFQIDTFDRTYFPSSGLAVDITTHISDKKFLSDATFARHHLDLRIAYPVNDAISLQSQLFLGGTVGNELPLHYLFRLGGVDLPLTQLGRKASFMGLKVQERAGEHIQMLQFGVQYEALPQRFVTFRWNIGNTFDEWNGDPDPDLFITGAGLTLGVPTFIGPVELSIMGGQKRDFLGYINVGHKF